MSVLVFFWGKHLLSKRPSVFFLPRWTNDVSSEAHVETMKQMRRENTRKLGLVSNIVSDGLVFTVIFHKNQRNVGIDIPYMDGMGYIFKHLSPLCLALPLQRRDGGHWITARSGQREHLAEATFKYQAWVESTWATKTVGCLGDLLGMFLLPIYIGGYFINHEIKISEFFTTPGFNGKFSTSGSDGFCRDPL